MKKWLWDNIVKRKKIKDKSNLQGTKIFVPFLFENI